MSGIFRDVYILNRPQNHIRDYKIETDIQGKINIEIDSDTDVSFVLENEKGEIYSGDSKTITVEKPILWNAEYPYLYTLYLVTEDEVIREKIGFREIKNDDGIVFLNNKPIKMKGVNRHDSDPVTGYTISMTGDAAVWFASFSTQPYSVIPYHVIVVAGTLLTLFLGAHSIEKTNKVMMPLFFLIFLVLAVRVALLPGSAEGYKFMFTPRWEALKDPMIWIWAMGQAFFSLSVTGSGMIVYGAYLSKDEDVVGVAQHTAIFDTIAAVVAALVIIPACFSYGLDVGAGPSLLFVTLPTILQDIPLGRLFAVILYVAMIFAGVSSLQNMFEAVAESLLHKFPKLSRAAVLGILCVLCLGFGLLMEPISKWGPWMDLVSIYIIPIGATLGAVSWFYIMKKDDLLAAVNTGSRRHRGAFWYGVGRYVYVPLAVILCCVALFMNVAF